MYCSKLYAINLALMLSVLFSTQSTSDAAKVNELHDSNSGDMFEGSWLVLFYAPWCPACQGLKPLWESFADEERADGLKIAQIDVHQYPALSGQFLIFNLPSIYHIDKGEARQYYGLHDIAAITRWAEEGQWRSVEPIPSWRSPNSLHMKCLGRFFNFANQIRALNNSLTEEYALPSWLAYLILIVGTIIIGLSVGLVIVCLCDCVFPNNSTSDDEDDTPVKPEDDGNDSKPGDGPDDGENDEPKSGEKKGKKKKAKVANDATSKAEKKSSDDQHVRRRKSTK